MTNLVNLSAELLQKLQIRADESNLTIEILLEKLLQTPSEDYWLYKQIVQAANDAILVTTTDGVFLEANKAAIDLLGYSVEELRMMHASQVYDDPAVRAVMLELLKTTGVKDFPYTLVRKDGRRIYCAVTAQRLTDIEGTQFATLSIIRDRTESKIIENTLRYVAEKSLELSRQDLYNSLVTHLGHMLGVAYVFVGRYYEERGIVETLALCQDGKIVDNVTYDVLNTPCADVLSDQRLVTCPYGIQQLFPEDFVAIELDVDSYIGLPLVSKSGKSVGILSVMDRKPLANRYLAETLMHIVNERVARELEREISEESLLTSNNRFRSLIDNIPAAVFIKDVRGVYIDVNQYMLNRFNLTYEQIIGRTATDLFPGDFGQRMDAIDKQVIHSREISIVEQEILEKRGKRIDLVHKFPLLDAHGEPYALCGIAIDITEQKHAQEMMQEAEKLRLELEKEKTLKEFRVNFLSMITHDINNPITSMKLAVTMLHDYWDRMDAASRGARFESIFYNISQISRLVDDILIMGEVQSGSMPFYPAEGDIIAFCQNVARDYQQIVELKHKFDVHLPHARLIMIFDAHLLNRALGNLINNAVKYSPAQTKIRFSLSYDENYVRISVSDQGIGVPEDDQPQLFQMFFRGSNAGRKSKGTGLGLAVVKYAADAHNGRVIIQSKVNDGSTFSMLLPIQRETSD